MPSAVSETLDLQQQLVTEARNMCVGQLLGITVGGQALVDFPGNSKGPVEARSVICIPSQGGQNQDQVTPVLLWFENEDANLPIIVGVIRDTASYPPERKEEARPARGGYPEITLDRKTITFDAKEEIVLRCGKSSLILKKDGRIVVKGTHLVSRSSGVNKIKGASVTIN